MTTAKKQDTKLHFTLLTTLLYGRHIEVSKVNIKILTSQPCVFLQHLNISNKHEN